MNPAVHSTPGVSGRPVRTTTITEGEKIARGILASYGNSVTVDAKEDLYQAILDDPSLIFDIAQTGEIEHMCEKFLRKINLRIASATLRSAQAGAAPAPASAAPSAGTKRSTATRVELGLLGDMKINGKALAFCTRQEVELEQQRMTKFAKFYEGVLAAMPAQASAMVKDHISPKDAKALMAKAGKV